MYLQCKTVALRIKEIIQLSSIWPQSQKVFSELTVYTIFLVCYGVSNWPTYLPAYSSQREASDRHIRSQKPDHENGFTEHISISSRHQTRSDEEFCEGLEEEWRLQFTQWYFWRGLKTPVHTVLFLKRIEDSSSHSCISEEDWRLQFTQ